MPRPSFHARIACIGIAPPAARLHGCNPVFIPSGETTPETTMRFDGTDDYVSTYDLTMAVNAARRAWSMGTGLWVSRAT